MNRLDPRYEWMSLADFEEMLPDKPSDEKWELIGGRVVRMMVGARWEHHEAASNIHVALKNHIRGKGLPCHVFQESFWLKDARQDLAVFPDIIVRCGAMKPGQTSVEDPVVLIEVLSRGTANRDLNDKSLFQKSDGSVRRCFSAVGSSPILADAPGIDCVWLLPTSKNHSTALRRRLLEQALRSHDISRSRAWPISSSSTSTVVRLRS